MRRPASAPSARRLTPCVGAGPVPAVRPPQPRSALRVRSAAARSDEFDLPRLVAEPIEQQFLDVVRSPVNAREPGIPSMTSASITPLRPPSFGVGAGFLPTIYERPCRNCSRKTIPSSRRLPEARVREVCAEGGDHRALPEGHWRTAPGLNHALTPPPRRAWRRVRGRRGGAAATEREYGPGRPTLDRFTAAPCAQGP